MPDIVLTTLNAKYIHAAFGLRYLMANLCDLQSRAAIVEFDINQRPLDIAEVLLAQEPKILGFGVYIWNVQETTAVISAIKRLQPSVNIILGGPEVSHETDGQPIVDLADHVITGEADLRFAEVCARLLAGDPPSQKVIPASLPEMSQLRLPYGFYDDEDIAHRVIYVEASRGCPFTCEFCLSSLDVPVRAVPTGRFLQALEGLLRRGARQFKFVDRTFNLNLATSSSILEFLLARYEPGMFFHFEMVPDRLPGGLRELVKRFPPGALQFEVGIQTFNETVAGLISRRQKYDQLADNLRFLRSQTGVHIHADLIVGLPGESVSSFGEGFDRLIALGPQEIQVGILKRLRGTPIVRHDAEWGMIYSAEPPYEILSTRLIPFPEMQRMRRFARYWDLVGNSGNFVETAPLLWRGTGSPFNGLLQWSDWLFARTGRTHGVALIKLMQLLLEYLTEQAGVSEIEAATALLHDYRRTGHGDSPHFLAAARVELEPAAAARTSAGRRQQRHLVS
ncbi:MAG TPA: B12-binding domain-containing radical SAM protein [Verrucomicrobiales bacterium]|nr:B12-binding domain-containing radical SAM protein [Verrucomicrobiales bacterium]